MYYHDLSRTVDLPNPATTVDDAVKAGLKPAKELLGTMSHYCVIKGSGELIIEYWSDEDNVKLINAECFGVHKP